MEHDTLVVNITGAPGAGKSTASAYVFSRLKMLGINAEYITEFAKDKVYEGNAFALKHQLHVFSGQAYKMDICRGKVDVIITDSPLPLSILYNQDPNLGKNFSKTVMEVYNSYNNITYYLQRVHVYDPNGRIQTEEESNKMAGKIVNLLLSENIKYTTVNGDIDGCDYIVQDVYKRITGKDIPEEKTEAFWVPEHPHIIKNVNDNGIGAYSDFHCSACGKYTEERNFLRVSNLKYCQYCGKKMKMDPSCYCNI